MSQIIGIFGLAIVPLILVFVLYLACVAVFDVTNYAMSKINARQRSWRMTAYNESYDSNHRHVLDRRDASDRRAYVDRRQRLAA